MSPQATVPSSPRLLINTQPVSRLTMPFPHTRAKSQALTQGQRCGRTATARADGQTDGQRGGGGGAVATPTVPGEPGQGRDAPAARRFCAPICCSPQLLWRGQAAPPHRAASSLPTWSLTLFIQMAQISSALRLPRFSRKMLSGLIASKPSSFTQPSKSALPSLPAPKVRGTGGKQRPTGRGGDFIYRGACFLPRF